MDAYRPATVVNSVEPRYWAHLAYANEQLEVLFQVADEWHDALNSKPMSTKCRSQEIAHAEARTKNLKAGFRRLLVRRDVGLSFEWPCSILQVPEAASIALLPLTKECPHTAIGIGIRDPIPYKIDLIIQHLCSFQLVARLKKVELQGKIFQPVLVDYEMTNYDAEFEMLTCATGLENHCFQVSHASFIFLSDAHMKSSSFCCLFAGIAMATNVLNDRSEYQKQVSFQKHHSESLNKYTKSQIATV